MKACAVGRPRGVEDGEGVVAGGVLFTALGGFVLVGFGVEGVAAGVEPDAVRFFPVTGVGLGMSGWASKIKFSPKDIAADIKYEAFWFLTAAAISASWAAARRLI